MKKETAKKNDVVGQFGIVSWVTGYDVGKIVGLKRTRKEFRIRKLSKPKILEGVAYPYFIETVEVDCDTGKVTLLKEPWGLASTKEKAMETAKMFSDEEGKPYPKKAVEISPITPPIVSSSGVEFHFLIAAGWRDEDSGELVRADRNAKRANSLELALCVREEMLTEWENEPDPSNCDPIEKKKAADLSETRRKLLREGSPSLFDVMDGHTGPADEKFNDDCLKARGLDYARSTGKVLVTVPRDDQEFHALLYSAIRNHKRRKAARELRDFMDRELVRGWICEGYRDLTRRALAEKLEKKLPPKLRRKITKALILSLGERRLKKLGLKMEPAEKTV